MLHEATACHVTGELIDILSIMLDLIRCIREYRDQKEAKDIIMANKDWLEVIRKLATLLNTYNPPEMRMYCIGELSTCDKRRQQQTITFKCCRNLERIIVDDTERVITNFDTALVALSLRLSRHAGCRTVRSVLSTQRSSDTADNELQGNGTTYKTDGTDDSTTEPVRMHAGKQINFTDLFLLIINLTFLSLEIRP